MGKLRTTAAAVAVMGALTLSACGHSGGDKPTGGPSATGSPPSSQQADPYQNAPWRMQVVNLLTALRTPQDGKYRAWMSDDPTFWTNGFVYTPRSAADPGWRDRNYDGSASVYPAKLSTSDKTAFFAGLTQDNTVIASTLTVTKVTKQPGASSTEYHFSFKIQTTQGKWLTGRAGGEHGTDPSHGQVERLTYDVNSQR